MSRFKNAAGRLKTALAVLVLSTVAVATASAYENGAAVKNFTGTDSAGKQHSLDKYRGKVVVVVAWCSQCMSCKGYSAELAKLAAANPQVVFLGVAPSAGETDGSINQRKQATQIPFPIIRDTGGAVAKSFGAKVMPTAYVIDAQGKLRFQGAIADKPKGAKTHFLAEAIAAAKTGASPAKAKTRMIGSRIKY